MGYYVTLTQASFTIPADKLGDAFEALKELNKRDELKSGGSYGELPDGTYGHTQSWFSWMDPEYDKTLKSAREILEALGFTVEDFNGGLTITAYDDKIGDEEHFIRALAPFVAEGSHLDWKGEDGTLWRQLVRNGQLVTLDGHVEYTD
jgi:hypothetical protein